MCSSPARWELFKNWNHSSSTIRHLILFRSEILFGRSFTPCRQSKLISSDIIRNQPFQQQNIVSSQQMMKNQFGGGKRSLTSLDMKIKRNEIEEVSFLKPAEETVYQAEHSLCLHNDAIVKKGLIWLQQDKLFSRWKETMLMVNKWARTKDFLNTNL